MREVRTTALPTPVPGAAAYEPHIAVDPSDDRHIAAVAMVDPAGGRVPRSLYVWHTTDGGEAWVVQRVEQPVRDGEGAVDPVVAWAVDGALLVGGMALSEPLIEAVAHGRMFVRDAMPAPEEAVALRQELRRGIPWEDCITVVRMNHDGRSTAGSVLYPSQFGDKPVIAVDQTSTSPYYGSVYVAWMAPAGSGPLWLARSEDGGSTFSPASAVVDDRPWGYFVAQLGVSADGVLHVIWTGFMAAPADAPRGAGTGIWHCRSEDGGRTFSSPAMIARHGGLDRIGLPSFAVAPDGTMLVVWGEASLVPADRRKQARHTLMAIRSEDHGATWSPPAPACASLPSTAMMGLPAITSESSGWWLLTYVADDDGTDVVLLRSTDGVDFFEDVVLASCPVPVDDFYLHGRHELTHYRDVVNVGDYVGIAASGSTMAAVFVLPEAKRPLSTSAAYVSVRRASSSASAGGAR